MNPDEAIKMVMENVKPDQQMALEAIKKANDTIAMLSNQLKIAEARCTELFVILATVLNSRGREIRLIEDDMIPLSPHDYTVTAELEEGTKDRIVRLRHITQPGGET